MAIVDLENGEPVCPGWKDKINDLMQEVRDLKSRGYGGALGDVIEWYGDISDPDIWDEDGIGVVGSDQEGWALCMGQILGDLTPPVIATAKKADGSGNPVLAIPNLQGKFTVMVNSLDADFSTLGLTGGLKEVLLTAEQSGLRDHRHDYTNPTKGGGGAITGSGVWLAGADITSLPTWADDVIDRDGSQDALEEHQNLPPFFVLAKKFKYK